MGRDRQTELSLVRHLLQYRYECAVAVTCHALSGARLAGEHAREALVESRLRRRLSIRQTSGMDLDAGLN